MSDTARTETVELVDSEHIVPRGSARTTWYVRVGDDWVRASDVPGARVEKLDPPPGSVWQRRIELALQSGTKLLRVRSMPRTTHKTPLAHLSDGPLAGLRVTRSFYRVGRRGALESVPDEASRPKSSGK